MRMAAGILSIALVASGCATPHQTRIAFGATAGVGGAAAFAGLLMSLQGVVLFDCDPDCPDPLPMKDPTIHKAGAVLLVSGGIAVVVGLVGALVSSSDEREPRETDVTERDEEARKLQAFHELETKGLDAAKAGDCQTVQVVNYQLLILDAASRSTTFRADSSVHQCLAAQPGSAPEPVPKE
jgi:hypothetical protein